MTSALPRVALIAALLCSPASFARASKPDVADRLNREVPALLRKYAVPGASIAYVEGDRIVYNRGFGVTNTIAPAPVLPSTVFQAGSIGKPVAAYVCLKLAQAGILDLDRPVASYVKDPWIDDGPWAREITVRQLLTHTAGLSNTVFPMDKTIRFEPGSRFDYSGVGYAYLTKIVESVSGKRFDAVASDVALKPLGMAGTTFDMPFMMRGNSAYPHVRLGTVLALCTGPLLLIAALTYLVGLAIGSSTRFRYYSRRTLLAGSLASGSTGEVGLVLASTPKLIVPLLAVSTISIIATALFWWRSRRLPLAVALTTAAFAIACLLPLQVPFDTVPSGVNAAYSMTTTSEDLGRFVVELSSLDQRTPPLNGMLREQVAIDPERAWGLGIGIEKGPGGATYWHSGINLGTRALIVIDPQTRTAIVVLANAEHGLDLARDVAELALGIRGRWDVPRAG